MYGDPKDQLRAAERILAGMRPLDDAMLRVAGSQPYKAVFGTILLRAGSARNISPSDMFQHYVASHGPMMSWATDKRNLGLDPPLYRDLYEKRRADQYGFHAIKAPPFSEVEQAIEIGREFIEEINKASSSLFRQSDFPLRKRRP